MDTVLCVLCAVYILVTEIGRAQYNIYVFALEKQKQSFRLNDSDVG